MLNNNKDNDDVISLGFLLIIIVIFSLVGINLYCCDVGSAANKTLQFWQH